jgi:glycosyltransferase involved in cell wall biosynthesis
MKILFITRNFPPVKGGLERVSFYIDSYLKIDNEVILLKWSGSKKWLFLVLPYFFLRAAWILSTRKIDTVYLNEGFLSVIGNPLRLWGVPVVASINGLDITFKNKIYQFFVPKQIGALDSLICISRSTKDECLKRGIAEEKISIIPVGFQDDIVLSEDKKVLRARLSSLLGMDIAGKKMIISVSRLVERKGVHWFVEKVVPLLIAGGLDFVYVIAGKGPMRGRIEDLISDKNLKNHVIIAGEVSEQDLRVLYNCADLAVMPNIPVSGDVEGFGVVVSEASSCGIPVIASDLEGIKDALMDGVSGVLVPARDSERFAAEIVRLLKDDPARQELGRKARELALANFSWPVVIKKYLEVFQKAGQSGR